MTLLELSAVLLIFLHEVLLDGSCHEENLLKFVLDLSSVVFGPTLPDFYIYRVGIAHHYSPEYPAAARAMASFGVLLRGRGER